VGLTPRNYGRTTGDGVRKLPVKRLFRLLKVAPNAQNGEPSVSRLTRVSLLTESRRMAESALNLRRLSRTDGNIGVGGRTSVSTPIVLSRRAAGRTEESVTARTGLGRNLGRIGNGGAVAARAATPDTKSPGIAGTGLKVSVPSTATPPAASSTLEAEAPRSFVDCLDQLRCPSAKREIVTRSSKTLAVTGTLQFRRLGDGRGR
jgi:hypothetical protein